MEKIHKKFNFNFEDGIVIAPAQCAEIAGLRYVNDSIPGYTRIRRGRGFTYIDKYRDIVTDKRILKRINSLKIPPAWRDVWISPKANGHIQVTGRDSKGRKQYIYHPFWEAIRNSTKFSRIISFARTLPKIREKVNKDLKYPSHTKEKVMAAIVRLLEHSLIRIGNTEYALTNESYGLTTLRNDHVEVDGSTISFSFRGKSGKQWEIDIHDRKLANIIKKCQELPGQELFEYIDENGKIQSADSSDVNEYIRQVSGNEFTAKDFRTWGGTVLMAEELHKLQNEEPGTEQQKKKNLTKTIKLVAKALNNTPKVCSSYYIHPEIINAYMNDKLDNYFLKAGEDSEETPHSLNQTERAVLLLLEDSAALLSKN